MSKQRLGHTFVSTGSTTRGARSAADCIGRVGGLAAALGVGAMLFVAPWAAAVASKGVRLAAAESTAAVVASDASVTSRAARCSRVGSQPMTAL